jgi:hypothetical protein
MKLAAIRHIKLGLMIDLKSLGSKGRIGLGKVRLPKKFEPIIQFFA